MRKSLDRKLGRMAVHDVVTNDTEAFKWHELLGLNKEMSVWTFFFFKCYHRSLSWMCWTVGCCFFFLTYFILFFFALWLFYLGRCGITYPVIVITVQFTSKYKCELLENNENSGLKASKSGRVNI